MGADRRWTIERLKQDNLRDTIVKRGGKRWPRWYGETAEVSIRFLGNRKLGVGFDLPSKGGGDTQISVQIGPGDFPRLVQFMAMIDRQAALEAMSEELSYKIHKTSK